MSNRPHEERVAKAIEARDLSEKGWKKWQIAKQLRMDVRTVEKVLAGNESRFYDPNFTPTSVYIPVKKSRPVSERPLEPEPPEPPPPTESDSVEFLRNARDNPKLAWADRIKCALAVAKLESGDEGETWQPPSDPKLWAEAVLDAVSSQSKGVLERVGRFLAGGVSENATVDRN